jgi:molybdenum cofactor biosynthesis protein A
MNKLTDKYGRVHDYLRISLIDKCNLNCFYCNPKKTGVTYKKKSELLDFEELLRLINLFVTKHGIQKIRFTGGEPMLRKDFPEFFREVAKLKNDYPIKFGITSNGVTLSNDLKDLYKSGLDHINISLDTLKRERFEEITGYDRIDSVLESINLAEKLGFDPVKVNTVIVNGVNDDEILDFVEFARERNINSRFIEFMPFGGNKWSDMGLLNYKEIRRKVEEKYKLKKLENDQNTVAKDFQIVGSRGRVSFISSISDHFCHKCNRLRITSSGQMKLCLFTNGKPALDFKALLSQCELSDNDLSAKISDALQSKLEKHQSVDELIKLDKNNMMAIGG